MTMMRRDGNPRSMAHFSSFLVLALLPASACTSRSPVAPDTDLEVAGLVADVPQLALARAGKPNTVKATGLVEIAWKGGNGKVIPPGEEKLAFAEFEAFPAVDGKPAKGIFKYRVLNADRSPHREIVAEVLGAAVNPELRKAWFVAEVISDEKICSGESCQSHDDGGGCGDDHSDGGCSSGGDDHDDGGCSGSGGHGGSGGLPGKDPRVGQFLVGKAHDGGSPGAGNDGITWKWYAPGDPNFPRIDDLEAWPHLCKKTIVEGNLVVHPVQKE